MFVGREKREFFKDREDKECRDIKVTKNYLRIVDESRNWNYLSVACQERFWKVAVTIH